MICRSRFAVLALAAAAVLGAAVPVLGPVTPADAHNYLVSSTPKAGEVLTVLPKEFVITTNDVLLNIDGNGSGFAIQVTDAAGRYFGDGCITIEGPGMSMPAALGRAGEYTVTWQVISTDGHTVSDSYTFTWQPPVGFAPSAGSTKAPDCNGTASINRSPASGTGRTAATTVDPGTLSTVLWIGGAILAVGAAVILTLVFTGRKKKTP
jgi:hypothetical protein